MINYWHEVDIYRIDRGRRVLLTAEQYDNHGPWEKPGPSGREDYALVCLEDYLARTEAPEGRWLVALWQLDPEGKGRKRKIAEVQDYWDGHVLASSVPQPRSKAYRQLVAC